MFVQLSDPAFTRELVRFFRAKDYLAVEEAGEIVVVPLHAETKTADPSRAKRDLEAWHSLYPAVQIEVVAD